MLVMVGWAGRLECTPTSPMTSLDLKLGLVHLERTPYRVHQAAHPRDLGHAVHIPRASLPEEMCLRGDGARFRAHRCEPLCGRLSPRCAGRQGQVYQPLLDAHQICQSMSRRASPGDHAKVESLFRSVKVEKVYRNEYVNLHDAWHHRNHLLDAA